MRRNGGAVCVGRISTVICVGLEKCQFLIGHQGSVGADLRHGWINGVVLREMRGG